MLSARCRDAVRGLTRGDDNGHGPLDSMVERHHDERVVRYRRCSERQDRGQALVSEWFVSEGRYTDTEAASILSRS
jgi:hypothetical protein